MRPLPRNCPLVNYPNETMSGKVVAEPAVKTPENFANGREVGKEGQAPGHCAPRKFIEQEWKSAAALWVARRLPRPEPGADLPEEVADPLGFGGLGMNRYSAPTVWPWCYRKRPGGFQNSDSLQSPGPPAGLAAIGPGKAAEPKPRTESMSRTRRPIFSSFAG